MNLRPAVFLDRDGVLNEVSVIEGRAMSPTALPDLRLLPGVPVAVERLRAAGWALIVVTNQPDIAKGLLAASAVAAMHASLRAALSIDAIYLCPHETADGCACRKPRAGMLVEAAAAHRLDLRNSWIVGDRWVDIAAGVEAGVRTILVDRSYSWFPTSSGVPPENLRPDFTVDHLGAAVDVILGDGPGGSAT